MKSACLSALLLLSAALPAQAPVPLAHGDVPGEPHHRLKIENSYVRAYYVEVAPHAYTQLHQHDHDYIFVTLGDTDVINAVLGKPETRLVLKDGEVHFSRGGFAHVARNLRDKPFRNVTIELLHPQGETQNLCLQIVPDGITGSCQRMSADREKGYSIEPQFETEEIKLDLVRFDPKAKNIGILPQTNSLIVVLNESKVGVEEEGGPVKVLAGGEVIWLEAGSHATLSNAGKRASSYLQMSFKNTGVSTKP
jgi:quercetin dioxygenase-like cupin family protein